MVDVGHAGGLGRLLDRVARLLLGADEQHGAAPVGDVAGECLGLVEQRLRLQQVDDVDAAALTEDETAHLRVPAARLVAEVDAGLQQLLDPDLGHRCSLVFRLDGSAARTGRGPGSSVSRAGPRRGMAQRVRGRLRTVYDAMRSGTRTARVPGAARSAARRTATARNGAPRRRAPSRSRRVDLAAGSRPRRAGLRCVLQEGGHAAMLPPGPDHGVMIA